MSFNFFPNLGVINNFWSDKRTFVKCSDIGMNFDTKHIDDGLRALAMSPYNKRASALVNPLTGDDYSQLTLALIGQLIQRYPYNCMSMSYTDSSGVSRNGDIIDFLASYYDTTVQIYQGTEEGYNLIKASDVLDKLNQVGGDWFSSILVQTKRQLASIGLKSYKKLMSVGQAMFRIWISGPVDYTIEDVNEQNDKNFTFLKERGEVPYTSVPLMLLCVLHVGNSLLKGHFDAEMRPLSFEAVYAKFPGHTASGASPVPGEYKRRKGDPLTICNTLDRAYSLLSKYSELIAGLSISEALYRITNSFLMIYGGFQDILNLFAYPVKVNKRVQWKDSLVHPSKLTADEWDELHTELKTQYRTKLERTNLFTDSQGNLRSVGKISEGEDIPKLPDPKNPIYLHKLALKFRDMYPVPVLPSVLQFCYARPIIEHEVIFNSKKIKTDPAQVTNVTGLDGLQIGALISHRKSSSPLISKDIFTYSRSNTKHPNRKLLHAELDGKAWDLHMNRLQWSIEMGLYSSMFIHIDGSGNNLWPIFLLQLAYFANAPVKFSYEKRIEVLGWFNMSGIPLTKTSNDSINTLIMNYYHATHCNLHFVNFIENQTITSGDNQIFPYAYESNGVTYCFTDLKDVKETYSLFGHEIEDNPEQLDMQFHSRMPVKFTGYWFKNLSQGRRISWASLGFPTGAPTPGNVYVPFASMQAMAAKGFTFEDDVTDLKFSNFRGAYEMNRVLSYASGLMYGITNAFRAILSDDKTFSAALINLYLDGKPVSVAVEDTTGRLINSLIPLDKVLRGEITDRMTKRNMECEILGLGRSLKTNNSLLSCFVNGKFDDITISRELHLTIIHKKRVIDKLTRGATDFTRLEFPFKETDPLLYQLGELRNSMLFTSLNMNDLYKILSKYLAVEKESASPVFDEEGEIESVQIKEDKDYTKVKYISDVLKTYSSWKSKSSFNSTRIQSLAGRASYNVAILDTLKIK